MGVYFNGKIFEIKKYNLECEFEELIFNNSPLLFGKETIVINYKTKISGNSLGNTIPDGFLFDFSDKDDIKFYLIEVELANMIFINIFFLRLPSFFHFLF